MPSRASQCHPPQWGEEQDRLGHVGRVRWHGPGCASRGTWNDPDKRVAGDGSDDVQATEHDQCQHKARAAAVDALKKKNGQLIAEAAFVDSADALGERSSA